MAAVEKRRMLCARAETMLPGANSLQAEITALVTALQMAAAACAHANLGLRSTRNKFKYDSLD